MSSRPRANAGPTNNKKHRPLPGVAFCCRWKTLPGVSLLFLARALLVGLAAILEAAGFLFGGAGGAGFAGVLFALERAGSGALGLFASGLGGRAVFRLRPGFTGGVVLAHAAGGGLALALAAHDGGLLI